MHHTTRRSVRPTARTIVVALLAGLAGLLLLTPVHGIDRLPPECYAVVGYPVPCDGGFAVVAAVAIAGVVGFARWMNDRRG